MKENEKPSIQRLKLGVWNSFVVFTSLFCLKCLLFKSTGVLRKTQGFQNLYLWNKLAYFNF